MTDLASEEAFRRVLDSVIEEEAVDSICALLCAAALDRVKAGKLPDDMSLQDKVGGMILCRLIHRFAGESANPDAQASVVAAAMIYGILGSMSYPLTPPSESVVLELMAQLEALEGR